MNNKKRKIKKPINNIYFYLILFLLMIIFSSLIFIFTNQNFESIRSFWGWWLIFSVFIILLAFFIFKFIRNIIKFKKCKNKNKLKDKGIFKL